jgi:hypothetical protein
VADYYLVTQEWGPVWDSSRARREQAGWDEHAAFMDALVEDPWAGTVLAIKSVEPWSVWLRRDL